MDDNDPSLPLAEMSVVEISGLESVAYAGMLLAQLGAVVVKVEPPGGDQLRQRPPLLDSTDGGERLSLPFEYLNAGKASTVFDISDRASVERLYRKLNDSDVLIVDHRTLSELELVLPDRPSGQLRLFVGLYGGRAEDSVPSSSLTRLHAGTSGYLVPADIDTSTRPGWSGPYAFECMHGVGVALAVVAERARPDGGDVDYSLQAYGMWLDKLLFSRTSVNGIEFHRNTAVYPYGGNMPCTDGFVAIFVIEEHQWRGLCHMIGKPEWLTDERFANGVLRSANREPIGIALSEWCAAHSVEGVLEAAKEADIPAGRCRRPTEVLDSEVLVDRQFFAERQTTAGTVRVPTLPYGPGFRGSTAVPSPRLEAT